MEFQSMCLCKMLDIGVILLLSGYLPGCSTSNFQTNCNVVDYGSRNKPQVDIACYKTQNFTMNPILKLQFSHGLDYEFPEETAFTDIHYYMSPQFFDLSANLTLVAKGLDRQSPYYSEHINILPKENTTYEIPAPQNVISKNASDSFQFDCREHSGYFVAKLQNSLVYTFKESIKKFTANNLHDAYLMCFSFVKEPNEGKNYITVHRYIQKLTKIVVKDVDRGTPIPQSITPNPSVIKDIDTQHVTQKPQHVSQAPPPDTDTHKPHQPVTDGPQSISTEGSETVDNKSTQQPNDNTLVIVLSIGAVVVILAGIFLWRKYYLKHAGTNDNRTLISTSSPVVSNNELIYADLEISGVLSVRTPHLREERECYVEIIGYLQNNPNKPN